MIEPRRKTHATKPSIVLPLGLAFVIAGAVGMHDLDAIVNDDPAAVDRSQVAELPVEAPSQVVDAKIDRANAAEQTFPCRKAVPINMSYNAKLVAFGPHVRKVSSLAKRRGRPHQNFRVAQKGIAQEGDE